MPATTTRPPAALTVVLVLVVVETVGEIAFVISRGAYGPGGTALVSLLFGSKILLAASARRLHAGSAMGLLMFELVGILVAAGADWPLAVRLGLAASVVVVFALVLSSLHAFPSPELP